MLFRDRNKATLASQGAKGKTPGIKLANATGDPGLTASLAWPSKAKLMSASREDGQGRDGLG